MLKLARDHPSYITEDGHIENRNSTKYDCEDETN